MLASFCLRLALGMIAPLCFLNSTQVPPRFYRVQYLTALALLAVAAYFLRDLASGWFWLAGSVAFLFCFAGSVVWHVEGNPGARMVLVGALVSLGATLFLGGGSLRHAAAGGSYQPGADAPGSPGSGAAILIADDFSAAALLGSVTAAMLMGHAYLIAPAMSLSPLNRLLGWLGVTLAARMALVGLGLYWWTGRPGAGNLETEMMLLLPVRWLLGLVAPAILGWMAWETARIRSTQSATGILYVVVIVGYLGELTSQVLLGKTGFVH